MQNLTQNDFREMMILSHKRIEKEKEQINKINVFPVPDQDTGDNLEKTLSGIKQEIEGKDFENFKELSDAILDGALTDAQGNAGVIYTGFLAGFLPELGETINVANLATAFEKGAQRAEESIQDPKQGTILDVINATALTFKKQSDKEKNVINVFEKAVKNADEALLLTREKMEILKKANVVDAGGMGFLMILESYLEALKGRSQTIKKQERYSEKTKKFIQIISNRYEIVALITNPTLKIEEIKQKLKKLGNSIDIVQVKNKMKIHIHTDYPEEVKTILGEIGKIRNLRVEDMTKEIVGEESIKVVSVGIVAESTAMLLPKIIERYKIQLIDCEKNWPEEKTLKENIFQKFKKREKIKTKLSSQIYLDAFEKQSKKFNNVLCITSSSKFYNYYDLAKKAKLMSSKSKKIFVLDSLNIGTGQALMVLKAIELIREQREIKEIIRELQNFIPQIHSHIIFENTKQKSKANRMQLYPILKVRNGKIIKEGVVLAQDVAEALTKMILKQSKKFKKIRLLMGYYENVEIVKKVKENLKSKIDVEVSFSNLIPPSVGSVMGSKAIIASWTGI